VRRGSRFKIASSGRASSNPAARAASLNPPGHTPYPVWGASKVEDADTLETELGYGKQWAPKQPGAAAGGAEADGRKAEDVEGMSLTPLLAGLAIGAAALGARSALLRMQAARLAPKPPRAWIQGGFKATMDRAEAARILGIRPTAARKEIEVAHRKVMVANHPDTGGSPYIATKVNEAKQVLMKGEAGRGGSNSAFS